jgi:GNAT superfamily N-acetyltransferase
MCERRRAKPVVGTFSGFLGPAGPAPVNPFTARAAAPLYHRPASITAETMTSRFPASIAAAPTIRQLGIADLADVLALQAEVSADLPAHFIGSKSESDLRGYLYGTHGVAYGMVAGDTLLAAALLRLPDAAHPNAKGDPPFPLVPEADWPCHAAFLENAMVLPAARGRGYQRALLDVRMFRAAASGMRWICSGCNLRNAASWSNLLARGMAIVGLLDRGFPLIGLLAAVDAAMLVSDPRDRVAVAAQDQAGHQAVLRDGYIGVRLATDGTVIYQRRTPRVVRKNA